MISLNGTKNGFSVLDDAEKVIGILTQGDFIEQNKNLQI